MRGRRMLGAAVLAGVGLVGWGGASTPAQADCLYITLYVTNQGAPPTYVNNGCVTNTPWKQRFTGTSDYVGQGHPHGTPNGYFLEWRIPVPG